MIVICRLGHIALYPKDKREKHWCSKVFGWELHSQDNYLTFSGLLDLPRYSVSKTPYSNLLANVTFEGQNPWDVLAANNFVFGLATNSLVPITMVSTTLSLFETQDSILATPLIQPGAFVRPGVRIWSYQGEIDITFQKLYVWDWESY